MVGSLIALVLFPLIAAHWVYETVRERVRRPVKQPVKRNHLKLVYSSGKRYQ